MLEGASISERLRAAFERLALSDFNGVSTAYGQIYLAVREMLLCGWLAPGELLSIRVVAVALNRSPMPVREALGRLMTEGVLESAPGRAFRVPVTTSKKFRDMLLMRVRLETLACEHASVRMNPQQLRSLQKRFRELSNSESPNAPVNDYLAAHRQFHFEIYQSMDMPELFLVIENLWLRMGPLFNASARSFDYDAEALHHAELLRAMELADPRAAAQAVENDLMSAGTRIATFLEELEAGSRRPVWPFEIAETTA
jgi:DNA-binding GntR family transcriptional regulator